MGLNLQQLRLNYYPNHEELRRALERGDVAAIGSFWDEHQQTRFPNWHQLKIGEVEAGLNWFLAKNVFEDRKERCAVIHALDELKVASGGDPYFKRLEFAPDAKCDER